MHTLKRKASSERGASITFALLLFLVCAIISSIVIIAATAVGGRASKLAEMDQRYYAVNSAAELVRDVLEGTPAIVETSQAVKTKVNQDLSPVVDDEPTSEEPTTTVLIGDQTVEDDEIDASLMAAAARCLADGTAEPPGFPNLSLTAPDPIGTESTSPLDVTLVPALEGDTLTLDISNTNNTVSGSYTLHLLFKASVSRSTDASVTYGLPMLQGEKYVLEKTTNTKTITRVQWKLIDVKPISTTSSGGA